MSEQYDGPALVRRIQALESELATTKARLESAEKVCRLGSDLDICHYEWCDRVVALAIKREIPPPECDCGVLAFKASIATWRRSEAEGGEKP